MTPASRRLLPFPLGPLLLLVAIFFLNFTARIILAPLLPVVTQELGLSHGEAGSLFLRIQVGYSVGLLVSGALSARLTHRQIILLSTSALGLALLGTARTATAAGLRIGLLLLGGAAGLYLPSGIATVTGEVPQQHWGKAIAIHELAPSLGFIAGPFLAEALLRVVPWQGVLGCLGALTLAMGTLFAWLGRGGRTRGEPLHLASLGRLLRNPSLWTASLLFGAAIGSALGLYAMIPLYLVREVGLDRAHANAVAGFARVPALALILVSGVVADRMGYRRALALFLGVTGGLTLLVGLVQGPLLTPILVLLQSASTVCFFPPGFSLLSLLFSPAQRGQAVSLVTIVGGLLGAGAFPAALGYLAEGASFSAGIVLMGVLTLAMVLLLRSPRAVPGPSGPGNPPGRTGR